jgi:hypothetical protein
METPHRSLNQSTRIVLWIYLIYSPRDSAKLEARHHLDNDDNNDGD